MYDPSRLDNFLVILCLYAFIEKSPRRNATQNPSGSYEVPDKMTKTILSCVPRSFQQSTSRCRGIRRRFTLICKRFGEFVLATGKEYGNLNGRG